MSNTQDYLNLFTNWLTNGNAPGGKPGVGYLLTHSLWGQLAVEAGQMDLSKNKQILQNNPSSGRRYLSTRHTNGESIFSSGTPTFEMQDSGGQSFSINLTTTANNDGTVPFALFGSDVSVTDPSDVEEVVYNLSFWNNVLYGVPVADIIVAPSVFPPFLPGLVVTLSLFTVIVETVR